MSLFQIAFSSFLGAMALAMRRSVVLWVVGSFPLSLAGAELRLAYERGGELRLARADGSASSTIGTGRYPRLSPDGRWLASNSDSAATTDRFLQITEIATGKTSTLRSLPSSNSFAPVWSPDSARIAFQTLPGAEWQIGICARDGSCFFLLPVPPGVTSLWNPAWARDGASIYCHDLEQIYRLGLDGKVLGRWKVSDLARDTYLDSARTLSLSEDGRYLLLSLGLHNVTSVVGSEPGSAIFEFDLENQKLRRLTDPKKMDAFDGQWLPTREEGFFFSAMTTPGKPPAIYRWQPGEKVPRRIVREGNSPSTAPQGMD